MCTGVFFGNEAPSRSRRPGSRLVTFGKHPAGNCRLEGGRNSLLESAQEATLSSLPTSTPRSMKAGTGRAGTKGPRTKRTERARYRTQCAISPIYASFEGWSPIFLFPRSTVPMVPASLILMRTQWTISSPPGAMPTLPRPITRSAPACPRRWPPGPATPAASSATLWLRSTTPSSTAWAATRLKPPPASSIAAAIHSSCLNAFPYTSGHVMIMPYAHLDRLDKVPTEAAHEMMDLAQRTEGVLERLYHPHGFNFGLNVGKAAGAGVAGHISPPRHAPLGGRHQLHDHRGRNPPRPRGPLDRLEAPPRGLQRSLTLAPYSCSLLDISLYTVYHRLYGV